MMSKSTISNFQLFEVFPNEEVARTYLEGRLWPNGPICPQCKSGEGITVRPKGFYRCNACDKFTFTVRTGTIFGRSHIPLHKWIYAMYLVVTARKGISSMQLAKEIGVTQKSAWFMLSRLREACGSDDGRGKLQGIIEIDEVFIGGKDSAKHAHKRMGARGGVGKAMVLGMRERGGRVIAMPIQDRTVHTIHQEIHKAVEVGATIYSAAAKTKAPELIETGAALVKPELADEWREYARNNTNDGYSAAVIEGTVQAMIALRDGKTPKESESAAVAAETGFQMGCVAKGLGHFAPRGDEFRAYWNRQYMSEADAAKADASGGTVNPAILTIGG